MKKRDLIKELEKYPDHLDIVCNSFDIIKVELGDYGVEIPGRGGITYKINLCTVDFCRDCKNDE